MTNYHNHPDYENLPDPLKQLYTPKEYAWLSDEDRESLEERETLPDE
jgi:hypothetical protein